LILRFEKGRHKRLKQWLNRNHSVVKFSPRFIFIA
jgi:hypothetical protein